MAIFHSYVKLPEYKFFDFVRGLSQTLAAHIGMRQTDWDPYALAAKLHHQARGLDLVQIDTLPFATAK